MLACLLALQCMLATESCISDPLTSGKTITNGVQMGLSFIDSHMSLYPMVLSESLLYPRHLRTAKRTKRRKTHCVSLTDFPGLRWGSGEQEQPACSQQSPGSGFVKSLCKGDIKMAILARSLLLEACEEKHSVQREQRKQRHKEARDDLVL